MEPYCTHMTFLTSSLPSEFYLFKDKTNQIEVECIKDLLAKRLLYYVDQVTCKHAKSCPTLCNPVDHSPPGFSVHGDSPGKNAGVGCPATLPGIFPTQGSNPCLTSPALAGGLFTTRATCGEPCNLGEASPDPHGRRG